MQLSQLVLLLPASLVAAQDGIVSDIGNIGSGITSAVVGSVRPRPLFTRIFASKLTLYRSPLLLAALAAP